MDTEKNEKGSNADLKKGLKDSMGNLFLQT